VLPVRHLLLLPALAVSVTACSHDGSGKDTKIAVTAGDSTCVVAQKTFEKPGDVTFDVENAGKDVTEVYVYAKGSSGAFDKVVGEVEDIAPGTHRDFEVDLGGGTFELACKPGQKGDGIRVPLTVEGKAADVDEAYDREIEVEATDYAFEGLDGFSAKVGEKIEFTLENKSTSHQHELEVFGPDGKAIGEVGPTAPGKTGAVVLTLAKAGTYTYESGVGDDAARGMKGTFVVDEK
jgi:plastocyanin